MGYRYDAVGRLATVTDENGHDIRFRRSRFGLASRTTAAGQFTDYVRGGFLVGCARETPPMSSLRETFNCRN